MCACGMQIKCVTYERTPTSLVCGNSTGVPPADTRSVFKKWYDTLTDFESAGNETLYFFKKDKQQINNWVDTNTAMTILILFTFMKPEYIFSMTASKT